MRIVADENIPLLQEFFGDLGEIQTAPGRQLSPEQVRDADVLLVRSVTSVNRELLTGSHVRFVGTATIGADHVDQAFLQDNGIAFANAPGCNAVSVVEYVLSALTVLAERIGLDWRQKRFGIVGLGNVGRRLKTTLEALGCEVIANDPVLESQGQTGLVSLEEVLSCDVISIHTPLTKAGPFPTRHLLNAERLRSIQPHQILINTARGPVIQEQALLEKLQLMPDWPVVLDVWEYEPQVNAELLQRVQLGSAHIAGYSLDGKMRGTEMIYSALCRCLSLPIKKTLADFLPPPPVAALHLNEGIEAVRALTAAIRTCYDVRTDDALLRRTMRRPDTDRAIAFDQLRKQYAVRREFGTLRVALRPSQPAMASLLKALGFDTHIVAD